MEISKNPNMESIILETAERLFLEKGFAMTSTTEIAKEAGCNQALVHYYFRTKEKLFETVFSKKAELIFSTFLQIEDEALSFEEKLKRKIEVHFELLRANPQLPFLMLNELTTNPKRILAIKEKIRSLPESVFARIDRELKEEIQSGRIRQIELIDLMMAVISLNMAMFLAKPIMSVLVGVGEEEYERMLERRKEENVRIIINSLKAGLM